MDKITKEEATRGLFEAAQNGDVADAQVTLDAGADVNGRDDHLFTPLHHAVSLLKYDMARLLIENGADINATSDTQFTPLDLAKTMDMVALLDNAAKKQEGHTSRVTKKRQDKGPPHVGG